MASVPESQWVPDDMATCCCICHESFSLLKRRHHCRTCGRVVCDDCSCYRIRGHRTCVSCWHRIGRKMSGLELPGSEGGSIDGSRHSSHSSHRSALAALLKEERYNREFVLADGRSVSYAVAGSTDGLPVFLFLGLDAHRHAAIHFEDVARRRGLRVICFDRPGRGKSDATHPIPEDPADVGGRDSQKAECDAFEADVVDIVKQMCSKLRIDKAGLLAHSVGSLFALCCARDEGLRDVFEGTTVCLVSAWVPLGGKDVNSLLQGISSTGLKGTLGRYATRMTISQTSDLLVWRGPSAASEIERNFLEAPYSQELRKHVCELDENKESIEIVEALIALHNEGEEDAAKLCARVLHPVRLWHGMSDQMVPLGAMRWMEGVLPSCTVSIKVGGTHSLVYDNQEMEDLFVFLQKNVSEAWAKHRFTARRITRQLSDMASGIFASGGTASQAQGGAPSPAPSSSVPAAGAPAQTSRRPGASQAGEPVQASHRVGVSKPVEVAALTSPRPGLAKPGEVVQTTSPRPGLAKPSEVVQMTSPRPGLAKPSEVVQMTSPRPGLAKPSEVVQTTNPRPGLAKPNEVVQTTSPRAGTSKPFEVAARTSPRPGVPESSDAPTRTILGSAAASKTTAAVARTSPRPGGSKPGEAGEKYAGTLWGGEAVRADGQEGTDGDNSEHGSVDGTERGLKPFQVPFAAGDAEKQGQEQQQQQRRGSGPNAVSLASIAGGGSWHSNSGGNTSLHGSVIPEEGEIDWKREYSGGSASVLSDVGRHMSRAFSDAFGGSDNGSVASGAGGDSVGGGGEGAGAEVGGPTLLRENHRADDKSDAGGSERGSERENGLGGGILRQMDRMISSLTIASENNSAHGSTADISTSGSRHDLGSLGRMASSGVGSGWRPTPLAPWATQHQDHGDVALDPVTVIGQNCDADAGVEDGIMEGLKRGVERALSAVGVAPSPSGNGSAHGFNSSYHELPSSVHSSVGGATLRAGVGYDAAMVDWPAGRIPGEPAWQEWGMEKKLAAHLITALGLALIFALW